MLGFRKVPSVCLKIIAESVSRHRFLLQHEDFQTSLLNTLDGFYASHDEKLQVVVNEPKHLKSVCTVHCRKTGTSKKIAGYLAYNSSTGELFTEDGILDSELRLIQRCARLPLMTFADLGLFSTDGVRFFLNDRLLVSHRLWFNASALMLAYSEDGLTWHNWPSIPHSLPQIDFRTLESFYCKCPSGILASGTFGWESPLTARRQPYQTFEKLCEFLEVSRRALQSTVVFASDASAMRAAGLPVHENRFFLDIDQPIEEVRSVLVSTFKKTRHFDITELFPSVSGNAHVLLQDASMTQYAAKEAFQRVFLCLLYAGICVDSCSQSPDMRVFVPGSALFLKHSESL